MLQRQKFVAEIYVPTTDLFAKSRVQVYFEQQINSGFVAHFSSNLQLVMQEICSCSSELTKQCAAFLQPTTNFFVAQQVDHAR